MPGIRDDRGRRPRRCPESRIRPRFPAGSSRSPADDGRGARSGAGPAGDARGRRAAHPDLVAAPRTGPRGAPATPSPRISTTGPSPSSAWAVFRSAGRGSRARSGWSGASTRRTTAWRRRRWAGSSTPRRRPRSARRTSTPSRTWPRGPRGGRLRRGSGPLVRPAHARPGRARPRCPRCRATPSAPYDPTSSTPARRATARPGRRRRRCPRRPTRLMATPLPSDLHWVAVTSTTRWAGRAASGSTPSGVAWSSPSAVGRSTVVGVSPRGQPRRTPRGPGGRRDHRPGPARGDDDSPEPGRVYRGIGFVPGPRTHDWTLTRP